MSPGFPCLLDLGLQKENFKTVSDFLFDLHKSNPEIYECRFKTQLQGGH